MISGHGNSPYICQSSNMGGVVSGVSVLEELWVYDTPISLWLLGYSVYWLADVGYVHLTLMQPSASVCGLTIAVHFNHLVTSI